MNKMQQKFRRQTPWLRVLCLIMLVFTGIGANAQVTVQVGTNGALSSYFYGPLYRSSATSTFHYSKYAYLYTAAEMTSAGIAAGSVITEIQFYKNSTFQLSGTNSGTLTILANNTANTALTSGTTWNTLTAGATPVNTTVYNSTNNIPGAIGWVTYTLSTPITYTGNSLEFYVDWALTTPATSPFSGGAFNWLYASGYSTNVSLGNASGSVLTGTALLSTGSYGGLLRPNTRFTWVGGSPCAGAPAPGNTIATPGNVCPGGSVTLSLQNATIGSGVTFQWYNNGGAIAGATNGSYTTTLTAADDFYCDVTCDNGGSPITTSSNLVTVTINPFFNCYCASGATSAADTEIGNVTFGSLNNTSTPGTGCTVAAPGPGSVAGMYSNYTSGPGAPAAPVVVEGTSVPFAVTQNSCGGAYPHIIKMYIDFNQNGSFSDVGETVFAMTTPATGTITQSGNILIPPGVPAGITRLRVVCYETSDPNLVTPCATFTWGETEDYLIEIAASTACSGTPNPGNTVASATATCPNTTVNFSLQNQATLGSNNTYQWYNNSGAIAGATNAFYAQLMTVPDDVYCEVTCTNSSLSATSGLVSITINNYLSCYCAASSSFGSSGNFYGVVDNVTIAAINNSTGFPAAPPYYTEYAPGAGTTTDLTPGTIYPLSINVQQYTQVGVWFDWNQNGSFEATEFTFLGNNVNASPITYSTNISVPITAPAGIIKMRVRSEAYFYANLLGTQACGNLNYGETEDYTITINALTACSGTPNPGNTLASASAVCPNGTITFSLQNSSTLGSGVTFQWYNNGGAIAGATGSFYVATITAADDFYCDVTCTNSGLTTSSNLVSITISPFLSCYCASSPTSAADTELSSFTFGSLTNSVNTCVTPAPGPGSIAGRYSNFTSGPGAPTPPVVVQGTTVPISLTQTSCSGSQFTHMASVFIDYNQNGSFSDPGEMVFNTPLPATNSTLPYTGNVTIPITATPGLTGMRVVLIEQGGTVFPGPCASAHSWGETEDYLVEIAAAVVCTGTPNPGNTIAGASSVCPNQTVNLSLQNQATLGSGNTYQWYNNGGAIAGATGANYTATITVADDFYCEVTCTNSGLSGTSNLVSISVSPFFNCYCIANLGGSCSINSMSSVDITGTTLNNVTGGCTGTYNAFPASGNTTASLIGGNTYTMNVGVIVGSNTQVAAWLDANQNGIYEASEYTLINGNILSGGSGSGTFTVPINALGGTTGLRVRSDWQGTTAWTAADACANRTWGETEDYVVTIVPPVACSGTPNPGNTLASASSVCPNGTVTLSLQNIASLGSGVSFQWYNNGGAIAGATGSFYIATITTADDFYADVTCTNSGLTASSNLVSISLSPFFNCYCITNLGGSCSINSMSSVDITGTTLNNVTGGCTGTYNAFPASGNTTASLIGGNTYTMNVGVIAGSNTQVAAWLDANQNGIYEASEYTLINGNIVSGGSGSGTFTVPINALGGTTGLRVRSDWQGTTAWTAADACANRTWGETEDYVVTIVPPVACSGTPNPGNTIASVSSVCPGSPVTLTLQNIASLGSGTTFQWYNNNGAIVGATNSFYVATLTTADDFYCDVTCTNSGLTASSNLVSVSISPASVCLCASAASFTADEEIYQVSINGSSTNPLYANANGCTTAAPGPGSVLSSYSNFTTLAPLASVVEGNSFTFEVRQNECDGATFFSAGIGIWIDWNQDGVLTGPNELIYAEPTTSPATGASPGGDKVVSGTFTVPMGALPGNTVMRVICAEGVSGAGLTPCLSYGYGETEDHLITVVSAVPCAGAPTPGNTIASASTLCGSGVVNFSLQTPQTANGITYQWYEDAQVIPGATGATYSTNVTATHTYECAVTCTNGPATTNSTPVTVTVNPVPTVSISASAPGVCAGGAAVTLTASGSTATYDWSPASGLSGTTGAVVTANPAVSTSYVVTATAASGCTATATQLVGTFANPTVSTTVAPSSVCPGDSVQFTTVASSLVNDSLFTTVAGGNGSAGNAFDIIATNTITISAFKMLMGSGTTAEVWYKAGGYGNAPVTTTTGWTQLGSTVSVTIGNANSGLTLIPVTVPLTIPAGQTYGVMVVTSGGSVTYSNGTTVGATLASNADATITQGHGGGYSTGTPSISFSPRNWNGEIVYQKGSLISQYSWTPAGNMSNATIANPMAASATTTTYEVTVTDANGCTASSSAMVTVVPCNSTLNLTMFIEGYWDGTSAMLPVLANQGETAPATATDSITVELRDAITPTTVAATATGILNQDGTAVLSFPAVSGNYYIAVKHRNAIETWSANPVAFSPNATYNFSTAATQAYGDNQKMLTSGVYGFYSGDVVKDVAESIDLSDLTQVETEINNFSFGYYAEDLNGDGNVDLSDSPFLEDNINNFIFSNHP
jgi:hypothetical protein